MDVGDARRARRRDPMKTIFPGLTSKSVRRRDRFHGLAKYALAAEIGEHVKTILRARRYQVERK